MVSKNETAAPVGPRRGGEAEKRDSKTIFNLSIFPSLSASDAAPEEPLLPRVAAARERDRAARAAIKAGQGYRASDAELLQARAWRRGGRP